MTVASALIEFAQRGKRRLGTPISGAGLVVAVPLFAAASVAAACHGISWAGQYSNIAAFCWLALSLDFLYAGNRALDRFSLESEAIFQSEDAHREFISGVREKTLSNRFLIIAFPLCITSGLLLWYRFDDLPLAVSILQIVFYCGLLFIASIGFWAQVVMIRALASLEEQALHVDPFHWDGFGGFRCCGTFAVIWCTLFFTGSLLFPKLLDIMQPLDVSTPVGGLAVAIPATFVLLGFFAFFYSQFLVHEIVARGKIQLLKKLKVVLDDEYKEVSERGLFAETLRTDRFELLKRYCDFFYARVAGLRAWPFDYKVIIQLLASALLPVLTAALEIAKRTR
jgi:hypothetical protein